MIGSAPTPSAAPPGSDNSPPPPGSEDGTTAPPAPVRVPGSNDTPGSAGSGQYCLTSATFLMAAVVTVASLVL
ncbi:unnamed protein product [Closterium sp. Naga37s-1]|nr:unnamed protein product [Closterium sp. Naga37s-1]